MKKFTLTIAASVVAFAAGMVVQQQLPGFPDTASADSGNQEPLYWVAPMDPNYQRDKPGKSPMGMDLVPVYEEQGGTEDPAGTVSISSVVQNNLGVRSETADFGWLAPTIDTVGLVGYDEDSLLQLNSRVKGWAENLQVSTVGTFVNKGSKLFDLYSPALVNAQEELLTAMRSGNKSLIRASRERLVALDVPEHVIAGIEKNRRVKRILPFYAPRDGYVSALNVREGGLVTPSKAIIELANLDSVWVIADVFERQSQLVKAGQDATMTVEYLPGQSWKGTVDYVYPELDSQTRSLRVRLRFDNPEAELKPNMYSRIRIETGAFNVLSIPVEALIQTGEQQRVVKNLGNGKFRSVRVETGRVAGDRIEVLRGLEDGDKVVTSAQFLLDSESSISADLSRFEEPASNAVWITGTLIDAFEGSLNITHAPVPEWGWPDMTMYFEVKPGVDVSAVKPGQAIRFEVLKTDLGGYEITAIEASDSLPVMDHSGMSMEPQAMPAMDHSQMDHSQMDHSQMGH